MMGDRPSRPEPTPERPLNFGEFVELDKPMTPKEAAWELSMFHKTGEPNVLAAFFNLSQNIQSNQTVMFRESVTGGNRCIIMVGQDEKGHQKWSSLIDMYTGQPLQHTS